ncbi:MAG: hypothetical protein AB8G86_10875 [Saprospiraceae bacterium]
MIISATLPKSITLLKNETTKILASKSTTSLNLFTAACTNDTEIAGWYFNGANYTAAMGNGRSGITPDLEGNCVTVSNMNRNSGTNSTTDGNTGRAICIGTFGVNNS